MKPETRRRIINSVVMLMILGGMFRFMSGELSRKDEIHEKEVSRLTEALFTERSTSETLRTELKEVKERTRIIREKDKDGNEKEIIERETDSTSQVSEYQTVITELEHKLETTERELEYSRKSSSPIGQAAAGTATNGSYYFRAGYAVFGPVGVEGQALINDNSTTMLFGINWTF